MKKKLFIFMLTLALALPANLSTATVSAANSVSEEELSEQNETDSSSQSEILEEDSTDSSNQDIQISEQDKTDSANSEKRTQEEDNDDQNITVEQDEADSVDSADSDLEENNNQDISESQDEATVSTQEETDYTPKGVSLYDRDTTKLNFYSCKNKKTATKWINLPDGGDVFVPLSLSSSSKFTKSSYIKLFIEDESGKKVVSETFSLKGRAGDKKIKKSDGWWFGTDYALSSGNYKIGIYNHTGGKIEAHYWATVYQYASDTLSVPKSISVTTGKEKTFSVKSTSPAKAVPYLIMPASSNYKIADVYLDPSDMKFKVYGEKPGKCTLTFKTRAGKKYKIKVTVKDGTPVIKYNRITLCKGEKEKNEVWYTSKKVKWSSSNRSIATVSSKGTVVGKKPGKCIVTAKVGKKKLKCKIKVVYRNPNFGACLWDYYTRSNTFVVKFRNMGNRTLTITSGVKVEDCDYKSFDRYIRLKKTVKIKPKSTKYVTFKVKGRVTWYNYEDFTLCYKFKYDGKTYLGHVWDEDSVYKKGKSWYYTYWTDYEDWYEEWLGI